MEAAALHVTDAAANRLREVAAAEGIDLGTSYLRVAVVEGGCSGLTYDLGWDSVMQEADRLIEENGLRVVLDRRSSVYLEGITLDFSDGLEGKGFHFHNPQASRTCACGESFAL